MLSAVNSNPPGELHMRNAMQHSKSKIEQKLGSGTSDLQLRHLHLHLAPRMAETVLQ